MRLGCLALGLMLVLAGCDNWGDYKYNSEKFKFSMTFPSNWEVWDKSDDSRDYLEAGMADKPEAKITVSVTRSAPDLNPNELYPTFESGGDDAFQQTEFGVDYKGTATAANGEGRLLKVHWKTDKFKMRAIRFLFVGNRFQMNINCQMNEDDYLTHEADFIKMVRRIQL